VTDKVPDPLSVSSTDWWRGAVIYQVYPRSFADANGDGIGDLAGITDHLGHIAALGVDAVWLSPFFTSPMKDFGYDVADYCDVDPVFGDLAAAEPAQRTGPGRPAGRRPLLARPRRRWIPLRRDQFRHA
jgi:alpha-glucosidase